MRLALKSILCWWRFVFSVELPVKLCGVWPSTHCFFTIRFSWFAVVLVIVERGDWFPVDSSLFLFTDM